jgi:hypothetical protein
MMSAALERTNSMSAIYPAFKIMSDSASYFFEIKFLRHALQRVSQELDYRIDICRVTKGAHIEHL